MNTVIHTLVMSFIFLLSSSMASAAEDAVTLDAVNRGIIVVAK